MKKRRKKTIQIVKKNCMTKTQIQILCSSFYIISVLYLQNILMYLDFNVLKYIKKYIFF